MILNPTRASSFEISQLIDGFQAKHPIGSGKWNVPNDTNSRPTTNKDTGSREWYGWAGTLSNLCHQTVGDWDMSQPIPSEPGNCSTKSRAVVRQIPCRGPRPQMRIYIYIEVADHCCSLDGETISKWLVVFAEVSQ